MFISGTEYFSEALPSASHIDGRQPDNLSNGDKLLHFWGSPCTSKLENQSSSNKSTIRVMTQTMYHIGPTSTVHI